MKRDMTGSNRTASCLFAALAFVGFAAAACSDIHPAPNAGQSGVLESPNHEAEALRRAEERQQQNRGGGGGGMGGGGGGGGGGGY
jgi:hypothetical protein